MSVPGEHSRRPDGRRKRFGAGGLRVSPCCDGPGLFCAEAWTGIVGKLGLSPRQAQIAKCVLANQSDDEIAQALGLSWGTVQTHMERLHERLGVHSRLQLATQVVATYLAWRRESAPPRGCPVQTRLDSPCGSCRLAAGRQAAPGKLEP